MGAFPFNVPHSVITDAAATRAYVSYWDLGTVILDISTPARPRYLGRTTFRGRESGDALLREVADRLSRTARGVDTVARLTNDDFAVLLEHTGGTGATAALGRLRASVGHLTAGAGELAVSAALGVATYRPGDSVASLLSRADAEMYAEKTRG